MSPARSGRLHRHTGGIPRRINTLGNRLMILGFLDELHRFSGEDVNRVAADLANEMNGATSRGRRPEREAAGRCAQWQSDLEA